MPTAFGLASIDLPPVVGVDIYYALQLGDRAKALDRGDSPGVGCAPFQSRLFEQKARDDTVDDVQHRRE